MQIGWRQALQNSGETPDSADLRGHTVRWEKTPAPAGDRRCRESSRLALAARAAAEVRSMWLPIWPIKRTEMNEIALANKAADWRRLKALVLDSVCSPITKRVYNLGLDEFFAWYALG